MVRDIFKAELTEREMFLVLNALEAKVERTEGEKSQEYEALRFRLETIFEGRD